jgi:methyl-accepting chemotaxis protein
MAAALNEALDKMRATLREVGESATNASASSQQLAGAATTIADGCLEQAASLEQTSASLEEMTATVRQNAYRAKQASELASGSKDAGERGHLVLNAVAAMEDINVASAKISDIISTIDEIAFQTNLLAVNAAVEAARAGEEGRGFAVVASEVRSLAQRSAGAAKEIKQLIQDSLRKVERGSELVHRVTLLVGEIAAASEEQTTGIEQVNTALTQMDRVAQSNASQTEGLSSTAHSLSEQSARLMELIGTFKVDRRSRRSREEEPAAPPRSREEAQRPSALSVRRPSTEPVRTVSAVAKSRQRERPSNEASSSAVLTVTPQGQIDHENFEEF